MLQIFLIGSGLCHKRGDKTGHKTNCYIAMKYLHRIKDKWAVRMVVRPDLQAEVGRKELCRWLGPDRKAAERQASATIAEFLNIIDAAETRMIARRPTLSEIAKDHFGYEIDNDAKSRRVSSSVTRQQDRESRVQYLPLLRQAASNKLDEEEAEAVIGWAVDRAIAAGQFEAGYNRAQLRQILAKVQLEAIEQE